MTDAAMCIACAGASPVGVLPYVVKDPADHGVFGGRGIARCPACGLQQILPVPTAAELDAYYGGVYRSEGRSKQVDPARHPYDSSWFLSRGRAVRAFIDQTGWEPHAAQDPAILDIGAGFGHVLFALSERWPGARLYATEPDPGCAPYLSRVGASILPQSAEGLPADATAHRFDIIVMTHVLEHLAAPTRALASLPARLNPGGRVLIEVPNCPPRFANQWESAPHLSFFEEASLSGCITRAGGRVVRMIVCGPAYHRRTWRDLVPAPVRRLVRRHIRPRPAGDAAAPDWRDAGVLPDPRFMTSGPDRWWLRACVAFD